MSQRAIPAVFMRGGTSKALFFHRRDLPPTASPHDCEAWNEIFRAAMGSPDPYGRQLDGMGGGQSSLSKVAIIAPSERPDADIDFTFAQVGVKDLSVGYKGNCGNISSAVGPFAVDEGLVKTDGEAARVRIFNTNTAKLIVATFGLKNGKAAVSGDYVLQGVAGSGAPIRLAFLNPGGAATGRLLPTGRATDKLEFDNGDAIEASLIDAANPVVCVMASAIGLRGNEAPSRLRDDDEAMARFEEIRIAAALKMGLVKDRAEAETRVKNLPLVALLADKASGASGADLETRMISAGLPHGAVPLTGAMCLAVGARIPETLLNRIVRDDAQDGRLRIAHASGVIDVEATVKTQQGVLDAVEAVVFRTARRLMEGRILAPL
ncbi:MAG: 2-methylaconitate cis-trans isomerase PrpF family protein [Amphiplicatus sp.]